MNYMTEVAYKFLFGIDHNIDLHGKPVMNQHILLNALIEYVDFDNKFPVTAVMQWSGQDMSYYHNQRKQDIALAKANALPYIQTECFRQLVEAKTMMISRGIYAEFCKKYPNYSKQFDIKTKEEITISDADIVARTGFYQDYFIFLDGDYAQEIYRERNERASKIWNQEKEVLEKERIKREYTCMKLFIQIEKNKMNSGELYEEYSRINALKNNKYSQSSFLNYFTDTKIEELHAELKKNGMPDSDNQISEKIDKGFKTVNTNIREAASDIIHASGN